MKRTTHFYYFLIPLSIIVIIFSVIAQGIASIYHTIPDYTARVSYEIGYSALHKWNQPWLTKIMWRLANKLFPLSGHIWVELASLEKYIYDNDIAAKIYLHNCQESPVQFHGYPASQCQQALEFYDQIDPPGTLRPHVINGL